MMRTALVLDADSPAGLEALQSLGRKGLATHAASPDDCLAFRSRRVSRRWKQPISEPTAFLRWLRDLDAEQAYALIVPSTERSLRSMSSIRWTGSWNIASRSSFVKPGKRSRSTALCC